MSIDCCKIELLSAELNSDIINTSLSIQFPEDRKKITHFVFSKLFALVNLLREIEQHGGDPITNAQKETFLENLVEFMANNQESSKQ